MFDITSITATETAFMHLKNPVDEEPIFVGTGANKEPVGIEYYSPGSEGYEAAVGRRTNRALVRSKKKIELTADLLRSDTVKFLTDITASFRNLSYPPAGDAKGEDLFKALYSDRKYGWVVEQANVFLADWAHFIPGSATS